MAVVNGSSSPAIASVRAAARHADSSRSCLRAGTPSRRSGRRGSSANRRFERVAIELTWGDWGAIGGVVCVSLGLVLAYVKWVAGDETRERWKRRDDP